MAFYPSEKITFLINLFLAYILCINIFDFNYIPTKITKKNCDLTSNFESNLNHQKRYQTVLHSPKYQIQMNFTDFGISVNLSRRVRGQSNKKGVRNRLKLDISRKNNVLAYLEKTPEISDRDMKMDRIVSSLIAY